MTQRSSSELAVSLQEALLGVPGVLRLYRPGDPAANLLRAGAGLIGLRDGAEPLVLLREEHDGLLVAASLGVDARREAGAVCRAAHAAAAGVLSAAGERGAQLRLTIVHLIEP